MTTRMIVGSRTSPLASAQTEEVLSQLRALVSDVEFVVEPVITKGDREKDTPLESLERGVFAKEIELALLAGEADFAVHSAKDLSSTLPDGLEIAAVGRRLDARDVLVNKWDLPLQQMPAGARIGTSSPRRTAQLSALRPDIKVLPIRGNVGTRLEKAKGSDYDGVVLAAAGIMRLGRQDEIIQFLEPNSFTPEVGQGTLALEARSNDSRVAEVLNPVDHGPSGVALRAERAFLAALGGGCEMPVAAYAQQLGDSIEIVAMASTPDGSRLFRTKVTSNGEDEAAAGRRAATTLLEAGAREIIDPPAGR